MKEEGPAPSLNAHAIYPKLPRMAGATALLTVGAAGVALVALAGAAPAPGPITDGDMRVATDRLLGELGTIRRILPRGALERRIETRAAARARRQAEIAAAAASPELEARVALWERLGLLPEGFGAARALGGALDAAPIASYDPLGHRLAVPGWIPLPEQRPALAHALAHALADQRFGIRERLEIDLEGHHHLDGDAERARLALVEGDAALTALELDDPRGVLAAGHALVPFADAIAGAPGPRAPGWLRAVSSFTHAGGLAFVARVRARQPWSAVDAVWADPPRSSEQVLHPEKYDAREAPVSVPQPPAQAFGEAWRVAGDDVLGELGVRTWLGAAVPEIIAERAAAGWGGDRATLYTRAGVSVPDGGASSDGASDGASEGASDGAAGGASGGASDAQAPDGGVSLHDFVAWSTVWDDVTDAEDFARAAAVALAALAGDHGQPDDPHRFVARTGGRTFALVWRGNAVSLLVGAPESALPGLDALLPPDPPAKRAPARFAPGARAKGSRQPAR
jgi:hypothetical protein